MAGKVFFSMSMSLDGFIAPEPVPVDGCSSPPSNAAQTRG